MARWLGKRITYYVLLATFQVDVLMLKCYLRRIHQHSTYPAITAWFTTPHLIIVMTNVCLFLFRTFIKRFVPASSINGFLEIQLTTKGIWLRVLLLRQRLVVNVWALTNVTHFCWVGKLLEPRLIIVDDLQLQHDPGIRTFTKKRGAQKYFFL